MNPWTFAPVGDHALMVTWRGDAAQRTVAVRQLVDALNESRPSLEAIPGITTVLVRFDPLDHTTDDVRNEVALLLPHSLDETTTQPRTVEITVRYGGDDGPDLAAVAQACGMTPADVVALHTAQPYPVLMLGFMPGFPYIGDLPPPLRLPRRATPRTHVPAGSVAIANDQTGIYPSTSPGGWHLLGRTDTVLFDPRRDPPSTLQPGDLVRFRAIDEP